MPVAIKVENLSKAYQLGEFSTGTLTNDIERWWIRMRGKEDPFLKIGESNDRTVKGKNNVVWSLKDIQFDIEQGEAVGIIGRNGAGKSTLLKILSRVTTPTTGSVKIKGRVASLLEVGTGFHPELTGRENIFLNGAILGMRKAEIKRKFDEIVDFAGVERYIDTPVKRYSSGMYVRLAFAVAAHLESEILVVDEVLAVGDAEFQKKCLGKMGQVSKGEGRTVLFVSHNMAAVTNLCNHGIVLHNGKVTLIADAEKAVNSYLSLNQEHALENNIRARQDRQGNGTVKVTEIKILDGRTYQQIACGTSGMDIIFRIMLDVEPSITINKLVVAAGINDMLDNRICHLSNELTDQLFLNIPTDLKYVDISISRLPLNAGTYNMTIYLVVNGDVTDWIQNAYFFTIEEGDFYKTGKTIPSNAGTFLLSYNYNIGI
jgi:lipopolysaccharide transport system ATP-binding protein